MAVFVYALFLAPWAILIVGYPFYVLVDEVGHRRLRRALGVLLAGVVPALVLAEIVFIAVTLDSR